MQRLEVFNEVTTVILVDLVTIFSAANVNKLDWEGDIAFLSLLFGNLAVHIFFLIKSSVLGMKQKCRKCKEGKRCCCLK